MKQPSRLLAAFATFLIVSIASACYYPPCPTCPPGSESVYIDFDEYYAGTLVGYGDVSNSDYDHLQLYSSANNSSLESGMGFTIEILNNDQNPEVGVGTFYDTQARKYYDYTNGQWVETDVYDDVDYRDSGVYTSSSRDGNDPDLEFSWQDEGNMYDYKLGNALIIQNDITGNEIGVNDTNLGYVRGEYNSSWNLDNTAPNDEGIGGFITLDFESTLDGFGFTWADLDSREIGNTTITFFDTTNNEQVEVSFLDFSASDGAFIEADDQGLIDFNDTSGNVVWGDGNTNRIDNISVTDLNAAMGSSLVGIDKVTIKASGSGGLTSLHMCYNAVPEASTCMAGAGLLLVLGIHFTRSRKNKKQD